MNPTTRFICRLTALALLALAAFTTGAVVSGVIVVAALALFGLPELVGSPRPRRPVAPVMSDGYHAVWDVAAQKWRAQPSDALATARQRYLDAPVLGTGAGLALLEFLAAADPVGAPPAKEKPLSEHERIEMLARANELEWRGMPAKADALRRKVRQAELASGARIG